MPVKAPGARFGYNRLMPPYVAPSLRSSVIAPDLPAATEPAQPAALVAPPQRLAAAAGVQVGAALARSVARGWFLFAVGSLVLAGLLSLLLVVGRLPFLSGIFTDPLFFKRALVVHVDLALVVWFQAGTLAFLALAVGSTLPRRLVGLSFALGGAGIVGLLTGALMPGAQPILSNYVPVIDHPVFLTGLVAWFAGSGLFFLGSLAAPVAPSARLPDEVVVALRTAAAGNLIALATFAAAWRTTLPGLPAIGYYELVMWGGGHALQAANVATMLALWLLLLHRWSGRAVLSAPASRWLLSALVAPHAILPVLAAAGTSSGAYVELATSLMRWTLFPVILIVLGLGVRHVVLWWNALTSTRSARPHGSVNFERVGDNALHLPPSRFDHRLVGLMGSASLAVLGIVLGAFIRGSNTLVPGHYHAAIGAVTLALMAAAYDFCAETSARSVVVNLWRRAKLQLLTFGVGQAVFAIGFGIAGVHGLGRKQYGVEQHVRSAGEYLGLGVMGLGGVLAVAGGLLFLAVMLRAIGSWRRASLS
jgi:cytochrome c oxidase subunit 1